MRIDDGVKGFRTYTGTITHVSEKAEFTPKIIQTKEERVTLVYAVTIEVPTTVQLSQACPVRLSFSKMAAAEAYNITHRYGKVTALDDVSFTVGDGELFGFIGPDGAGKTTLFRIAATLIIPSGGRMTLLGLNTVSRYRELRNHIGYMPGRFSLYNDLTVEENLNFFATIFGTTLQENYNLIEPIYRQIEPYKKRLAGKLSGGMKQKLALVVRTYPQTKDPDTRRAHHRCRRSIAHGVLGDAGRTEEGRHHHYCLNAVHG